MDGGREAEQEVLGLKPLNLSDDEVRRRNGWKPGAIVPRWIAMLPH